MDNHGGNDPLYTELEDGIFLIRFNRPEKKNALNVTMYSALVAALQRAEEDDAVRVVLITGCEGCFTSGNDLTDFMSLSFNMEESPVIQFLGAISRSPKPLIAAVNGTAVGIGVTMLLHCDLVYAGSGAVFQLPFVNLGLCPEAGSTLLMPMMMGHQRAAELILLGEPFSAEKAFNAGIVNEVLPDDKLLEYVRKKAQILAVQPPSAVCLSKALLKKNYAAALRAVIIEEGREFIGRLSSPEAAEAFRAFMERRKPDFSSFN